MDSFQFLVGNNLSPRFFVFSSEYISAISGLQEELYDLECDPHEHINLLHPIARHPLRFGWTQHDMAKHEASYSYNEELLERKLTEYREIIGEIWSEGFMHYLRQKDALMHQQLHMLKKNSINTLMSGLVR